MPVTLGLAPWLALVVAAFKKFESLLPLIFFNLTYATAPSLPVRRQQGCRRRAVAVGCYTMETFKTKYNYLVLGLRLLFFLFFVALLIGFFLYSVPKFIDERKFKANMIVGMIAVTFLVIFLCYRFFKLLRAQRNILSFEN